MAKQDDYDLLLARIAENIRALRLRNGLTQEQMTEFGFNYRHYQRLESGNYSPSLNTLYRLSKVFKVSIASILT